MKNDQVHKGRGDIWASKSLPFEPRSNVMQHQNTIVPKSIPPHWRKGNIAHKSLLSAHRGRAYLSTQSLALSKSCMVKCMQSLIEYTKDLRIWVRRKHRCLRSAAHF